MSNRKTVEQEATIKKRRYDLKSTDEFSSLDYQIIASRSIVDKIYKAILKIEDKFTWDEDIKKYIKKEKKEK